MNYIYICWGSVYKNHNNADESMADESKAEESMADESMADEFKPKESRVTNKIPWRMAP